MTVGLRRVCPKSAEGADWFQYDQFLLSTAAEMMSTDICSDYKTDNKKSDSGRMSMFVLV